MTEPLDLDLARYVTDATEVYRKGDIVKEAAGVVTIDAFPQQQPDTEAVDCHFVTVGFTDKAGNVTPAEFYQKIAHQQDGAFTSLSLDDFAKGPSYITIGAWIGDQTLAFRFMALGQHLGLWRVVTPATLGFAGPDADRLAGQGFVMTSGITDPATGLRHRQSDSLR